MFDHPYICLITASKLSDRDIIAWMQSIMQAGPNGITSTTQLADTNSEQKFYMRHIDDKFFYCAVLSRNLESNEAAAIADQYQHLVPSGDFEIQYSQTPQVIGNSQPIDEDILKSIALEAAKYNHSKWLHNKLNEGWRYGRNYSVRNKTSPMCCDWHTLAESYKRKEYFRIISLLEVLDKMNLSLVSKKH